MNGAPVICRTAAAVQYIGPWSEVVWSQVVGKRVDRCADRE